MAEAKFTITVTVDPADATKSVADDELDTSLIKGQLIKAEETSFFTLCVSYPANKADVAVAADGRRDYASERATELAAWNYLTKSPKVGLWHADGTEGAGRVVESYIWRADPWTITAVDGSTQTICKGDWLLGIRWQPETFAAIQRGEITGVSPQGRARRRIPSPEAVANLRS